MAVNRQGLSKEVLPACRSMSTTAKTAGRGLASNWDIALTSTALALIVGGIAAPHVRRLIAGRDDAVEASAREHDARGAREKLAAVV
jgi:hypothetical protein